MELEACGVVEMSLACLVCPGLERSPSHSFRSLSVSSSDNDGRRSSMTTCLNVGIRRNSMMSSSKVSPYLNASETETPRLVRSRAVRRDQVSEWNFDGNGV